GIVGGIAALGDLAVNSTGITKFGSTVTANSLTTNTGGTTEIGGDITTTGKQTYGDGVALTGTTNQELKSDNGKILLAGNLTAGSNDVTLTANDIELPSTTTGKGNLTIQSATTNQNITLGNNIDGTLNLTSAEIASLVDGFASITIGRNDGTGNIVINNSVEFKDPTTIKSPNGNLAVNDNITGIDNASITLDAKTTNLNADITTNNQNITLTKNVVLENNITLDTGAGAGDINFNGTVDGNKNLTLNAGTGNITLDNAVNVNSLSTTAMNTNIANKITTTGNQQFTSGVTLTGNNAKTFNSNNNDINFSSTINGSNTNLTLQAGTGNLTLGGAVAVNSLSTTAANTNIANNITTTGNQQFTGGVTLKGNNPKTFNSNNNGINFSSTLNGSNTDLTLQAGNLTLDNVVNVNSLNVMAANTNIANNITTTNNQTFNSPVTLTGTGNQELKADTGTITFNRSLSTGNNNLTLTANGIDFLGGDNSVTGSKNLVLQPSTPGQNININNDSNADPNSLDLTKFDINALADGFSSITIGRNDSKGVINIPSDVTFKDIIKIQSPTNTGSITATSTITGLDNASINLLANQNISTGDISTQRQSINLKSNTGFVRTENITTQGGDIDIQAQDSIKTGLLDTSSKTGNGGKVSLDPENDIEVTAINTQALTSGIGGDINIVTNRFFRATGTFTTFIGSIPIKASISTLGINGSGNLTITHGGNGITAFVVGNTEKIGTAGAVVGALNNNIIPTKFYQGNYTKGNIQIITNSNIRETAKPSDESYILQSQSISNPITKDSGLSGVEDGLTKEYEQFFGRKFARKSVADIQSELRKIQAQTGIKSAIVYAYFSKSSDILRTDKEVINLRILTSDSQTTIILPNATKEKVLKVKPDFQSAVSNANSKNYKAFGKLFYRWLIAPYEAELQKQGITNLAFAMGEDLRSIPMAALYDGEKFLIEKYSLGLIPSANSTDIIYSDIKKSQVLAMGASKFAPNQKAQDLPAAEIEVTEIAKLWNGKYLLNDDFTIENLKDKRQNNPVTNKPFEMVHLATHLYFDSDDANNSYIQLHHSQLPLNKVRELGWNQPPLELLVLSACQSASEDSKTELGFTGLAVNTGVKSAVGSLWKVEDAATMVLMTEFYHQLKTTSIKAEALRQAQVAMIKGDVTVEGNKLIATNRSADITQNIADKIREINPKHPYYWSAFMMIGGQW
ncbi:CHAT domain-containing protein, partial [Dolichospermum sp. LEGE 00246]|uniref:CHAT domain-containing protein n=1 Tax=Dolichospermum sp. LEGE 00246 TaxID=1828605 RepID=UPI00187E0B6B